ncbi:hypothetical protein ACFXPT_01550 [Streptomyces goshikiensis]|uniref:hypothetical protein n=1 Tax=Streptomyces goshikiensis TaxID=1942 RepID=UPI0036892AAC
MIVPAPLHRLDLHNGGHRFLPFLVDAVAAVAARGGTSTRTHPRPAGDLEPSSTDFLYDTKGMD